MVNGISNHYDVASAYCWNASTSAFREQCILADDASHLPMGGLAHGFPIVHSLEHQGVRQVRAYGYVSRYLFYLALISNTISVDMAVPYEDQVPGPGSDFASIRDSFYILMTMNQFTMNPQASVRKESEGLLRIALFSKDLRLHGTTSSLKETRQKLAQELREGRKRGVVPVFISTMWFLFALGLSIQSGTYLGHFIPLVSFYP